MKIALVLLLSALSMQAFAANIGERLTPWTLQDQHDQPYTLDTQTRGLLVARNMDGSKLVKAGELGIAVLDEAAFVERLAGYGIVL